MGVFLNCKKEKEMKATWLVENFVKEPSYTELVNSVIKSGRSVLEIKGDYSRSMLTPFKSGKNCVVFNGSINMTEMVYRELYDTCYPISYCNHGSYFCTKYYPYLMDVIFNDNPIWTTVEQFIRKKFFYYGVLGKEAMLFVRPDSGNKEFQAGLFDLQDVDRLFKLYNKDQLILLASPKNIRGEWRFVVSKFGEIISYSTYQFQGQITKIPGAPQGAIDKCKQALSLGYFPDSVFVIDICEDNDGNYWVLELNSFSSAGLYACDKDKIVQRVSEIAEAEAKDYYEAI